MRVGRLVRCLVIFFPLVLAIPLSPLRTGGATAASRQLPSSTHLAAARVASLPLSFEPNVGQADPSVRYLAHGAGFTLFLTDRGATISYSSLRHRADPLAPDARSTSAPRTSMVTIGLFPVHSAPHPRVIASGLRAGRVNYFLGHDPRMWHTDVPTFDHVVYNDVYPGVDLVFHGSGGRLEYDWKVGPHADVRRIVMQVEGARSLLLEHDGSVALSTGIGVVHEQTPRIYQTVGGRRMSISGGFRLLSGRRIGLHLGRYDTHRPLIVDPVLTYSSYFGSGVAVYPTGLAADGSGDVFMTGWLQEDTFIPTMNPYQAASAAGSIDGFLAKLNVKGTGLIYSTYFGGTGRDRSNAVAVDAAGNAYVAGWTESPDFPGAPAANPQLPAGADFAISFSPAGDSIRYGKVDQTGTSIGATGIAVDSAGTAFYAGATPASAAGKSKMFVRMLLAGGAGGGAYTVGSDDYATSIAVDSRGFVYVAGVTSDPTFPTGLLNPRYGGGASDAFVMQLSGGLSLDWSTFLGGSGDDGAEGVAVDPSDNVYVTGFTTSGDFPTSDAYQGTLNGAEDVFVTELTQFGQSYVFSTYLGGNESESGERGNAIAVDAAGSAYVAGYTTSLNFPVVNPPLDASEYMGTLDAFVFQLAPGGASPVFTALLGGPQIDQATGVAVDPQGDVFVTGNTSSGTLPITSKAVDRTFDGTQVGFLSEFSPSASGGPPSSPPPTILNATPPTVVNATPPTVPKGFGKEPTPTPTPTVMSVPPPASPNVTLAASKVNAGSKLKISVTTVPRASITITMRVNERGKVVFSAIKTGQANNAGSFTKSIRITYHPAKKVKAHIKVDVRTAGGSASKTATVTIIPHP